MCLCVPLCVCKREDIGLRIKERQARQDLASLAIISHQSVEGKEHKK